MQDYWHHWQDVTCGFLLGALCAFVSYRQHYPSITSPRAGEAFVTCKGNLWCCLSCMVALMCMSISQDTHTSPMTFNGTSVEHSEVSQPLTLSNVPPVALHAVATTLGIHMDMMHCLLLHGRLCGCTTYVTQIRALSVGCFIFRF